MAKKLTNKVKKSEKMVTKFLSHCFWASVTRKRGFRHAYIREDIAYSINGVSYYFWRQRFSMIYQPKTSCFAKTDHDKFFALYFNNFYINTLQKDDKSWSRNWWKTCLSHNIELMTKFRFPKGQQIWGKIEYFHEELEEKR